MRTLPKLLLALCVIGLSHFNPPIAIASSTSPTIAAVYALPSDLTTGAPAANYKIKIRTIGTLAAGTSINFYASQPSTAPTANDFDFSGASLSVDTLPADTTLASVGFNQGFALSLQSDLVEGTYEFSLNDVVNASTGSEYVMAATTDPISEMARLKLSPYFSLGNDPTNSNAAVYNLTVAANSSTPASTSDVTVNFVTTDTIAAGNNLYFYFDTATYTESLYSSYDLSGVSFSSETISGTMSVDSRATAFVQLTADLSAGSHAFVLSNVTHPSDPFYFVVFRLSGTPNAAIQNSGSYINSQDFDVVADDASDNTLADQLVSQEQENELSQLDVPTKLKVKKLERRSATLRWSAVDGAEFYKLQLRKKNNTKVKTWKRVTANRKAVTKDWLRAGKTYKFRVKACNETDCSAFSDYKQFTTEQ